MTGRSRSDYRSSVTRSPATRIDGRSAAGKRIRDLFRALMVRLNEPADIMVQADILALAELKTAAEVARVRLLEKGQNSNECVRLENLTRRAELRLGLEPGAASKTEPGDWRDLFTDDDELQSTDDGSAS